MLPSVIFTLIIIDQYDIDIFRYFFSSDLTLSVFKHFGGKFKLGLTSLRSQLFYKASLKGKCSFAVGSTVIKRFSSHQWLMRCNVARATPSAALDMDLEIRSMGWQDSVSSSLVSATLAGILDEWLRMCVNMKSVWYCEASLIVHGLRSYMKASLSSGKTIYSPTYLFRAETHLIRLGNEYDCHGRKWPLF